MHEKMREQKTKVVYLDRIRKKNGILSQSS